MAFQFDTTQIGKTIGGTGSLFINDIIPLSLGFALCESVNTMVADQTRGQSSWLQAIAFGASDAIKASFYTAYKFPEKIPVK